MDKLSLKNTIVLQGREYNPGNIRAFTDQMSLSLWGKAVAEFVMDWLDERDYINVQTSGSTGMPKQLRLPKKMMAESAQMTGRYLGLKIGDKSLLCLPAQFIAGKMMIVRAFTLGLDLYFEQPSSTPEISRRYTFAAMTPHQVATLLETQNESLSKISKLIIGGGSLAKNVSDQLQALNTQCYLTYGMTETSSHIALQKINGPEKSDSFELIDKHIRLLRENDGRLSITGGFLGDQLIQTNDMISSTGKTTFQWLGRADFVINTGGIKVHPETLENRIRDLIPVPFIITGIPDPVFQQRIVLLLEPGIYDTDELIEKLSSRVLPHEKPVKIFVMDALPRTENGKIIRHIDFGTGIKQIWERKV